MINTEGVSPKLREYITMMEKAMLGDIVMSISNATLTSEETILSWTRDVLIQLKDANGNIHKWINGSFANKLAIADTSSAGTASITSTTLTIIEGQAVVTISGTAAAWLPTETNTLTVSNLSVMGYTVTGGTSVETFEDAETPYIVTFSAGANGSLTATADDEVITSGDRVDAGAEVVFTATADELYELDAWGDDATGELTDTFTIASLDEAVTVSVTFKLIT